MIATYLNVLVLAAVLKMTNSVLQNYIFDEQLYIISTLIGTLGIV